MENSPGQPGKARIPDLRREPQFPRAKCLILEVQFPVGRVVAIFGIPQDRAADMRQMGADLVGPPSDEIHLQQRKAAADRQRFVAGQDLFGPGRRCGEDANDASFGIFVEIVVSSAAGGCGRPKVTQR